jgi:hypothetical protein
MFIDGAAGALANLGEFVVAYTLRAMSRSDSDIGRWGIRANYRDLWQRRNTCVERRPCLAGRIGEAAATLRKQFKAEFLCRAKGRAAAVLFIWHRTGSIPRLGLLPDESVKTDRGRAASIVRL